jgi:spermidine synthase
MGGLALGTYLTNRYLPDKGRLDLLAGAQVLVALLAAFITAVLPHAAALQPLTAVLIIFYMLTFSAGLANGISFPLAAACFMTMNRHAEKSAGAVYGVELFGACAGAVLAGAVVAPVLGIVACCLLGAIVNIAAFVVILVAKA